MKQVLKRSVASAMALLMVLGVVLGMVACGPAETPCTHQWGEWSVTVEPTLEAAGEEKRTCALCEESETREVPKLEACTHEWSNWEVTTEPTYEAAGEEKRTCALCGESETQEVAKLEPCSRHSWSKWTTTLEPTYEAAGSKERTCSVCGQVETREVPKLDPDDVMLEPIDKEYDRGNMKWHEYTYVEPNFDEIGARVDATTAAIIANELPFEELAEMVLEVDDDAGHFTTAYSYCNIQVSLNNRDEYWMNEYTRVSTAYSGIVQKFEKLYIAAADSPLVDRWAEEVFGEWIRDYAGQEASSDTLVALKAKEAELEAYYESVRDTASKSDLRKLYLEMTQVRRQIADEMGLENYFPVAYESMGRDYSVEETEAFLTAVGKYINVLDSELESFFKSYFAQNSMSGTVSREKMLNVSYRILGNINEEYQDIFNYMILSGMYSIEKSKGGRDTGAFVTWLNEFNSPYLFVTLDGSPGKYSTIFHEFGHFVDYYINGDSAGIDMAEISSQALEFMFASYAEGEITSKQAEYMRMAAIKSALGVFTQQCLFAAFEHEVYKLSYEELTMDALYECAKNAGQMVNYSLSLDSLMSIPHLFLYPCYVQSYATSLTAALIIFQIEMETPGAGLEMYVDFIDRREEDEIAEEQGILTGFKYYLEEAGIPSPFEEETIKDLANFIYRFCKGKDYFTD